MKKLRMESYRTWEAAHALMERRGTASSMIAEQEAWDSYMEICGDLHECTHPGCDAYSPDHILCDEHRPYSRD